MIRKVLILEARKLVLLNAVTFNCVKMLLLSNNSYLLVGTCQYDSFQIMVQN